MASIQPRPGNIDAEAAQGARDADATNQRSTDEINQVARNAPQAPQPGLGESLMMRGLISPETYAKWFAPDANTWMPNSGDKYGPGRPHTVNPIIPQTMPVIGGNSDNRLPQRTAQSNAQIFAQQNKLAPGSTFVSFGAHWKVDPSGAAVEIPHTPESVRQSTQGDGVVTSNQAPAAVSAPGAPNTQLKNMQ